MTGEEFLFLSRHASVTGRGATAADHRHGKKVRVRHTRHSQAFRVQPAHSQSHQEKRKDRQSHYPDWTQDYRGCGTGAGTGWQENRRTQIKEVIMDYIKRNITRTSRYPLAGIPAKSVKMLRKSPRNSESTRLCHRDAGQFQRIHRQSQEQENLQCIGYRSRCIEERYRVTICG